MAFDAKTNGFWEADLPKIKNPSRIRGEL